MNSTLFAHETAFWMWLRWTDALSYEAEWRDYANHISMTEVYSNNFFPPMDLEGDL